MKKISLRLHEVEYPGKLNTQSDDTLSDWSMECLNQIKELQQELDQQLLVIQRIEMSILGYSSCSYKTRK